MPKVSISLYFAVGIISVILGLVYMHSPTFMPYHAVAIGREWAELSGVEQVLFGALLDVAGAGWIALGAAIIVLTALPVRQGEKWARYLVPALAVIFYVPTLLATLSVLSATPASPPWWGNVICLAAALLAFLLDRPFSNTGSG